MVAVERSELGWPSEYGNIWLPVTPFTHIYGYLMGVTNPTLRAGTVVIPDRFYPDLILDMMETERVTVFGGDPPAIHQALMASDRFGAVVFDRLRLCANGGAPFHSR